MIDSLVIMVSKKRKAVASAEWIGKKKAAKAKVNDISAALMKVNRLLTPTHAHIRSHLHTHTRILSISPVLIDAYRQLTQPFVLDILHHRPPRQ